MTQELVLLFIASYLAAAISGAAGFGGALLLLPLLISMVGVEQAVPLLTLAQFIGNLSRAGFGIKQIHWKPVGLFLLGAMPSAMIGAIFFVQLPPDLVTRLIGLVILVFVALKCFGILPVKSNSVILVCGGIVVGFLSGLAGSAGPLGAAIFLSLGLPPVAYIASEATTALAMHGIKMLVYQHYFILNREFWLLASLIGVAMILGTWSAKRVIANIPTETFQWLVTVLLIVGAGYMVIHG